MRRQKNVSQMREQNSRKRTKQMERSSLQDAEFKTLVIRMLNEFSGVGQLSEDFKKEIENIKKNQK